ncbi:MAG: 3-deoxy-manno-octulosonate cytidylyltransferase [Kangiellaceae bacterium]|jgi:3-deoxy-manno-octulosonate cytidylyltransferase (CMP-KDO synthetase)|nr:3-deoxy-manno-octulosonate cytidylyltransferase [Kangiellaceae bacterium]
MSFYVVIPARYDSSRLPGKPLADIAGLSMIQRVIRQAQKSDAIEVIVATDDQRIVKHVESIDGQAVMTSRSHQSGTDRINEVCKALKLADDAVVVNVQGDEPFIPPQVINQVAGLLDQQDKVMATLCTPIKSIRDIKDPNVVKVVTSNNNNALYFSRSAIPFDRDAGVSNPAQIYLRHLGIYAYRVSFLAKYATFSESSLEHVEKLEQLRVLENGYAIAIDVAECNVPAGVDTAEDLVKAQSYAANLS